MISIVLDKKKLGLQDLSEVYSALYSAADKWYNFGLTFGIDPVQLKTIQSSESNDQARLHEMLSKWLDSSTCPTWTDICNGLRTNTVEKVSLVQIIEQKYCSKGKYISKQSMSTH